MAKRVLRKPDGRMLTLYGRRPIAELAAPSPSASTSAPNAHLRWHPLRAEWVAYATHRQNRTFLPPAAYNPLAPRFELVWTDRERNTALAAMTAWVKAQVAKP